MKVLRNNATYPGILNGLQVYLGTFTNNDGSTRNFIVDNIPSPSIVFLIGYAGTTIIAGTEAAGTKTGTRKITWAVPAAGVFKYLFVYADNYKDTIVSVAAADTTVSDHEVY